MAHLRRLLTPVFMALALAGPTLADEAGLAAFVPGKSDGEVDQTIRAACKARGFTDLGITIVTVCVSLGWDTTRSGFYGAGEPKIYLQLDNSFHAYPIEGGSVVISSTDTIIRRRRDGDSETLSPAGREALEVNARTASFYAELGYKDLTPAQIAALVEANRLKPDEAARAAAPITTGAVAFVPDKTVDEVKQSIAAACQTRRFEVDATAEVRCSASDWSTKAGFYPTANMLRGFGVRTGGGGGFTHIFKVSKAKGGAFVRETSMFKSGKDTIAYEPRWADALTVNTKVYEFYGALGFRDLTDDQVKEMVDAGDMPAAQAAAAARASRLPQLRLPAGTP